MSSPSAPSAPPAPSPAALAAAAVGCPVLTREEIDAFHREGYISVRGVVRPEELEAARRTFERFMAGELRVEGKDHGEHLPGLMNVTAFSLYHDVATVDGGIFGLIERRCKALADQLYEDHQPQHQIPQLPLPPLAFEYCQLLRKLPARPTAQFPPHQDALYWPKSKSRAFDMRTATCSVAINDADEENGCLWVLPRSHASKWFYPGCITRREGSRPDGGGVIDLEVLPDDIARRVFLPLASGDVSVHEEWIVHGSEGNAAMERTRDTLIYTYRAPSMIAMERELGFRHSYNDGEEVLRKVREHIFP